MPWIPDTSQGYQTHYENNPDKPDVELLNEFSIGKNYELFGILASVRSYRKMKYDLRGLPKDLSDDVMKVYYQDPSDWHTPSWLTPKEFKSCLKAAKVTPPSTTVISFTWPTNPWDILNRIEESLSRMEADNILLGDPYKPIARLIFWFDS